MPTNLRSKDSLVVALCPWSLHLSELDKLNWMSKEPSSSSSNNLLLESGYASVMQSASRKIVTGNPLYQRALRMLKFPKYLHDFMSKPDRPYCLWYNQQTSGGAAISSPDVETAALQAILNHCGATNVGLKADVKAIFIHVGSLSTMWKIPSMWARRNKRPEIRFFTYGTHERALPSRWGIHEVYRLGELICQ